MSNFYQMKTKENFKEQEQKIPMDFRIKKSQFKSKNYTFEYV
jgi:hypothetical protein